MGGEIWVTSELHRGSEFHFRFTFGVSDIPRQAPASEAAAKNNCQIAESLASGETKELSILLAEDNPANRMVARLALERAGFRVHGVENGRDAVDAIRRSRFDVVLMDVLLP